MGIVDMFNSEDRVQVKFSDFYSLVKEATKAEFLMNGIKNCVETIPVCTQGLLVSLLKCRLALLILVLFPA